MSDRLQIVSGPEGRRLGVAQWGDADGAPALALHGTPGSRLARPPDEDALRAAGLRLVTYDRPGYGASDRSPGRRVVDCVADVTAIVDALGIDRFVVAGGSGGGPHALAVAAGMVGRVVAAEAFVSPVPIDTPGVDWTAGMDPENVREFGWAFEGEQTLRPCLERLVADDLARMDADPSKTFSEDWQFGDADRSLLARPDLQRVWAEMLREAYRSGVDGWVDDDLALITPWGFDIADIRVPVTVRYGETDVLVPAEHGRWLAEHVPGARVVISHDGGHLSSPEDRIRALTELAQPLLH